MQVYNMGNLTEFTIPVTLMVSSFMQSRYGTPEAFLDPKVLQLHSKWKAIDKIIANVKNKADDRESCEHCFVA